MAAEASLPLVSEIGAVADSVTRLQRLFQARVNQAFKLSFVSRWRPACELEPYGSVGRGEVKPHHKTGYLHVSLHKKHSAGCFLKTSVCVCVCV